MSSCTNLSSFTKYIITNNIKSNYIREKKYYELGVIFQKEKLYNKMKKYFELAIKNNDDDDAMNNLGFYYHQVENNFEISKKYLQMSIDKNNPYAMNNFGIVNYDNAYYDNAKKYYLMAIEYDLPEAYNNLGLYYYEIEKNNNIAKSYFLQALQKNNNLSHTNINIITTPLERYVLFNQYEIPFTEKKNREINIFINRVNNFGETKECTICFEEYTNIPTECGHYFCVNCYVNIFTNNFMNNLSNTNILCPICRINIYS